MGEEESVLDKKKPHVARHSGVKAEKKRLKKKQVEENLTARQRNPKAFAINSTIRAERNFRRKEDLTAKKQHIPLIDQTPDEPPPVLIGIVGPPKVGKTTLINNLIKSFTKTNVTDIKGPITIVTSKKRRITLIECNNDINSMIDIAKCADLILLLCDASFGFEMEIFEFLNICQVHGMPKVMGVLTHLDMIKNAKALKRRKKELKHRFWTEVYDGAKLFYLSGIIHGEYLRNEIKNLGRFISVMKFRPLTWRGAHSYVLVDRVEDVTNTEMIRQNPKCDRNVVLYGYMRGVPMNKSHMVHIAGVGDLRLDELNTLPDPCPLPGTEKKRSLLEKERLLYAPMSGVGGLVYDKDAVYIELQGSHSHTNKNNLNPEQEELMTKLKEKKQTVDQQIEEQEFRLFSDGDVIKSKNFRDIVNESSEKDESENEKNNSDLDTSEDENDEENGVNEEKYKKKSWNESEDEEAEDDEEEIDKENEDESSDEEYQDNEFMENKKDVEDSEFSEENEENEEEDEILNSNMAWKQGLAQKAREAYFQRQSESKNLMKLVYGVYNKRNMKNKNDKSFNEKEEQNNLDNEDNEEELGGLFKVVSEKQSDIHREKDQLDKNENCFFENYGEIRDWSSDENRELIKNCFVTGKWKASEDAEELLKLDDMSDGDSEIYGDFEDLETGEKHSKKLCEENEIKIENDENLEKENNSKKRKITRIEEENMTKAELMAKKMKLKAKFDAEYDNKEVDDGRITGDHSYYENLKLEVQKQSELNQKEFAHLENDLRIEIEGFRAGLYIRMGFSKVPSEFIENLDTTYPILVGGLNMSEENVGYINCKVKKHRWYKKILKTGDPLIISLGWRRFQTIPIFAKIEDNLKHRYLKYTPNHITCSMTFWGPITPQNTGFLALQSVTHNLAEMKRLGFRIAATGSVTEIDKSTQIMKKLKLVGTPFKIYKKSAFIKGMFNSSLEVAKFEGAKVKTVSGIRGQIKKAHSNPEGSFRATFEDKILLSDIVFCRTWFRVDVPKFYAPITSLLLPPEEKSQWKGMKTLGELKREKNIKNEPNIDSLYTEIKREPKVFKPLKIPKSLQKALPYKDKPKHGPLDPKKPLDADRIAVIRSPHEQKVAKMMSMIHTNYEEKQKKEKQLMEERLQKFRQQKNAEEMRKLKRQKELRKKISRALSKMNKTGNKS